ncbi:3-methylmercaptopropionyl-CoA dehydrogenase [Paraconexibacter sp. AEG42_29]|uniref:3-methylmercaptopropionyl-CoA dehydrogenase n=1 Tax=Paraconexibacter sp. AEG42_29 TaxID=2997339 RepID=A0AAU7B2K4_9ACTN
MSTPALTASSLLSRRDLQFLLHEWLKVEELCDRPRFADHSRDTFDEVLTLAERIATDHFAPHNREADANEPHIGPDGTVVLIPEVAPALAAFADAGLMGGAMDEAVGGIQLPQVVASAAFAWFQAANVGSSAYPFLTVAAANMLLVNGSPEQIETWVRPMIEGRFFGTMCLSETQAGSSLADVTTRAEPQDDGSYRVFGTKMWISGGEHELAENIVHLVLAKIPGGPPGVKGISLFVVPRLLVDDDGAVGERNDVVLAGLNHKMGFRGTVNTVLGFGEGTHRPGGAAGAVGYLVGEPHKGLAYMFHMMNEARIGVGLGAACLGYTGYLKALQYARERPQGRTLAAKGGTAPQVPIIEHADVKRMLLAQKSYVEGAMGLVLYCGRLVDEEQTAPDEDARARAALLLDVLTPITKSWPSQWCVTANDLAIQVHGGYGYAREYDVEQHYRDNRLNPIHEGTHGIQGLDLLGRKVTMRGGAGLGLLAETITATVDRARSGGGGQAAAHADALAASLARLLEVTGTIWGQPDVEAALANATAYLEAAGHIVVAWIWLEQLLAVDGRDGAFYDGKRQAAAYFLRYELPKAGPQLDLLASLDRTTLEMQDAWF